MYNKLILPIADIENDNTTPQATRKSSLATGESSKKKKNVIFAEEASIAFVGYLEMNENDRGEFRDR